MALCGAETWTLRGADQKHLESFETWCWRRMEKISWTDHVRNEEVLLRVNGQNILHEIRKRKANWIGHILRRNCLLKEIIEGKIKGEIEVTRRRGRRRKKLLDDLKSRRGYSHLKEEALDRTMWRNRFGGGFGPVVRQNTEWWYIYIYIFFFLPLMLVVGSAMKEEISSIWNATQEASLLYTNLPFITIVVCDYFFRIAQI